MPARPGRPSLRFSRAKGHTHGSPTSHPIGCDKPRAGLRAEGVDFEERDVMKNKEWFDFVVKHTIFVPLVVRGDAIEIGWKGAVG